MSYAEQYKAVRARLVTHISSAWTPLRQHYGTVDLLPTEANLPAASILKGSAAVISPNSPTVDESLEQIDITGVWARPESENLEDFCLDRFEELRALVATDHHLNGTVTDCQVTGFDYDIPSGTDPMNKRVYVYATVTVTMPFYRDGS
mgnify:CR=1 FL=1